MKKYFAELMFVMLFALDIILFRLLVFSAQTDGIKFIVGGSACGLLIALIVFAFSYADDFKKNNN